MAFEPHNIKKTKLFNFLSSSCSQKKVNFSTLSQKKIEFGYSLFLEIKGVLTK